MNKNVLNRGGFVFKNEKFLQARILYGFRTDLPGKEDGTPYTYDDYTAIARQEAAPTMPERSFGRNVTAALRRKLAAELLKMEVDLARHAPSLELASSELPPSGESKAVSSASSVNVVEIDHVTPPPIDPELETAISELTREVRRRVRAERRWRKINDPFPLPVRWTNFPDRYVDHWDKIRGVPGRSEPIPLAGSIEAVTRTFDSIPSRRLVILGPGGSGKTTLALELASAIVERQPPSNEPVPVVFNLPSWNPYRYSLSQWLTEHLADHYLGSGSTRAVRISTASRILDDNRITPILDGYDEMAPGARVILLRTLNSTFSENSVVLTSRAVEYVDTIKSTDTVVTRAAAIRLEPLSLESIEKYLPLTSRKVVDDMSRTKWHPVIACMRSDSDAQGQALRRALTTPLMVSLARAIYSDTRGNPNELLDSKRFPSTSAISDHLLDRFVDGLR
jgi:energy-coupling factor transporter ATP-binding protein EcfA2